LASRRLEQRWGIGLPKRWPCTATLSGSAVLAPAFLKRRIDPGRPALEPRTFESPRPSCSRRSARIIRRMPAPSLSITLLFLTAHPTMRLARQLIKAPSVRVTVTVVVFVTDTQAPARSGRSGKATTSSASARGPRCWRGGWGWGWWGVVLWEGGVGGGGGCGGLVRCVLWYLWWFVGVGVWWGWWGGGRCCLRGGVGLWGGVLLCGGLGGCFLVWFCGLVGFVWLFCLLWV